MNQIKENPEISIILPCRNEEAALDFCLNQIEEVIKKNKLNAEIIVSDSSVDSSPDIASRHNVILVKHDKEGYGNAYIEGFKKASGKYLFMADPDCTYDFNEIPIFVSYLKQGYDLIIGNRFGGEISKGAMSWSHKYIGNPLLSSILRLFFKTKIHDAHCGMRAITREVLNKLKLRTEGMEFASEMIISALRNNLRIKEVPIGYHIRKGKTKLKPFRDAWRHFRFMLLYSPMFLFFIPGFISVIIGVITMIWFYFGSPQLFGIQFYFYPMFISSLLILTGYQLIMFSAFAKSYAVVHLDEKSQFMEKIYKNVSIEKGLLIGGFFLLFGIGIFVYILTKWVGSNFGSLNELKNAILAITMAIVGIQTIFSSFMLSIIGIRNR
jgi:glycosyltransferase involved in cell wall biosynthesis